MPSTVNLATYDQSVGVNLDAIDVSRFDTTQVLGSNSTGIVFRAGSDPSRQLILQGTGFTYGTDGTLTGGSVTSFTVNIAPSFWSAQGFAPIPAVSLVGLIKAGSTQAVVDLIFGGDDGIQGSLGGDLIRGGAGGDSIFGDFGADSLFGGAGDDVIFGRTPYTGSGGAADVVPDGANYIRGEAGNDSIEGAASFDDINGNQGNDSIHGGEGNDWVVGGQDNDQLWGDNGNDIVYGNLGNDTLSGGNGDDWVRGGQGDDVIDAGAGNDIIWGDRGSDTISGGQGGDIFHTFIGAGIDRVTDFSQAQGDRVFIDDRVNYATAQVGADTVITLAGGDTMTLAGVTLSNLTAGWIATA